MLFASDVPVPTGPLCTACSSPALVQWSRRPTAAEFQAVLTTEQKRREMSALLADPSLPTPDFGPLPDAKSMSVNVFACAAHAVSKDLASQVHGSTCTAPPACTCTPEVAPVVSSLNGSSDSAPQLPPGW